MAELPGGPYWQVDLGNGKSAPWYILPFDKDGNCTAPKTRANVLAEIASKKYTDVYIFSHGWNNDWDAASARYHRFIDGFLQMRREHGPPAPEGYQPILIGIFWPSTALVLPWERAPKFAGAPDLAARSIEVDQENREIESIAAAIEPASRQRFYELVRTDAKLLAAEARELAEIALPIYNNAVLAEADGGVPQAAAMTTEDVLAVWTAAEQKNLKAAPADQHGFFKKPGAGQGLQSAGWLDQLDPRNIVRTLTVYQMKDRAGTVGAKGVGPVLREIAAAAEARVHLVGHSYGAKVVLSALCASGQAVHSVLLLQPAVNGWCFAANVDQRNYAGGYVAALNLTALPIFTTFSRNDAPLTKFFHLAVRRADDLGELKVAMGNLPKSPSVFGALGGFGPQGLGGDCRVEPIKSPGEPYDFSGARVIALNGDDGIESHGAVEVPKTFWALLSQVSVP